MLTNWPARACSAIRGASKPSTQIRLATCLRATSAATTSCMVGGAQQVPVRAQVAGDLADGVGVEERRGADLDGAAAGQQELHRVLGARDAADADDRNGD